MNDVCASPADPGLRIREIQGAVAMTRLSQRAARKDHQTRRACKGLVMQSLTQIPKRFFLRKIKATVEIQRQ